MTEAGKDASAEFVSQKLRDYKVLRMIFFMQDILKITSILSLLFQKENSTCSDAVNAIETACFQLIELRQGPGQNLQEFMMAI